MVEWKFDYVVSIQKILYISDVNIVDIGFILTLLTLSLWYEDLTF